MTLIGVQVNPMRALTSVTETPIAPRSMVVAGSLPAYFRTRKYRYLNIMPILKTYRLKGITALNWAGVAASSGNGTGRACSGEGSGECDNGEDGLSSTSEHFEYEEEATVRS